MTVDELRTMVKREPFQPFTVHINDGSRLKVSQPDDIFLHRNLKFDVIIVLPKGRFSIVYVRNISHVSTRGQWPRFSGRRRRNGSGGGEE
jgi:hypothetical protein